MGYMHVENLYRNQDILIFKECYALEKIHGTSAHVSYNEGVITYFTGENHQLFLTLFDEEKLKLAFESIGHPKIVVFGEHYAGKCQGMSHRYGKESKFVAFEVKIGDWWLGVPNAEDVVKKLGLEFVHYVKIPTDLDAIDAERDAPSVQAVRNGITTPQPREGVVLRPIKEFRDNSGNRIMAKHKRDEERETKTPRNVREIDPAKMKVLEEANAIADEWVTPMRLAHVLQKLGPVEIKDTPKVIEAMVEDVLREGEGEIVDSKEARKAIGTATSKMFVQNIKSGLYAKV